jgi:hypothetical protein
MIVKVQISQFDSEGETRTLIYNKSRNIEYEGPATDEVIKLMRGNEKLFFHANEVQEQGKPITLKLLKQAPWQDW